MKTITPILIALCGIVGPISSQLQNNIWYFGNKAGLDFNFTPPLPLESDLITLEGTASICDPAGQLLFYTNGANVWDRNHNIMPNGSGLLGGESSTQAALIVPLPNSCDKYYLFTTEDHFTNGGLSYSIVDMCLHDGYGDIVKSSKNTLVVDKTTEKVTAVLHSNGVDIWILTHTLNSDDFLTYLLTSSGLNTTPVISSIGSFYNSNAIIGPVRASHDGTKIISAASFHGICEMFDFNSSTGQITNPFDIYQFFTGQKFFYGIEFSPNDKLLYLSTFYVTNYLYQLNLESNELTQLNSVPGNYHYGALQMGPDKKIYMARNDSSFVDVINFPNLPGFACQYVEHGQDLLNTTTSRSGLPNFAPYSFFQDTISNLSLGDDTTLCMGESLALSLKLSSNCPVTYLWSNGSTSSEIIVNKSGTYWGELESSCSIYSDTIQIQFNPPINTSFTKEICTGESFEGYSETGIYIDTFLTSSGCDSIRTLNLMVTTCAPECGSLYAKSIGSILENERGYSIAVSETEKILYVGGLKNDSLAILKINTQGEIEWTRMFDIVPNKTDHINGMFMDSDGMLGIAGTSGSLISGGTVFVFRYDPLLNLILWSIELISTSNSFCSGMIEMGPGGNYLISNNPTGPNDAELIELDKLTGEINKNFSKHYDLGSSETLSDLVYYQGKIYSAGRFTDGGSSAQMRNTLIKLDPFNGTPDWVRLGHLPQDVSARLYGVDLVIDQGQIFSISEGDANGTSLDFTEIFIQKTSLNGDVTWIKKYDLPGSNDWLDELIASDSGLVVLARSRVSPSDNILFKINHVGEVLWAKKFDFSENDNSVLLGGITSQLIELDHHIYFTSIAETGGEENMILVKAGLNGEINDTCSISTPIEVNVTTVEGATFYSAEPDVFTYVPEVVFLDLGLGVVSVLPATDVCSSFNTILSEVEVAICEGESYEGYGQTGIYTDTLITNEGCDSIRVLNLTVISTIRFSLKKDICNGDIFEGYSVTGIYSDTFSIASGCDSIRTLVLSVISCLPIVKYDLDDCTSFMFNGTNMDYTEFTPSYPSVLSCAEISANYLFRSPPQENKHSCTPGINGSVAMCVSSLNSCSYVAGHQASVVIEFSINPQLDSVVKLTGLEFYQKGPSTYSWISGPSGLNNYPTLYGIRILKNGTEIFKQTGIQTTLNWTLQSYDFIDQDQFVVDENTTFRIELLPYCPIGNASAVSAWDLDEIYLYAGCVPVPSKNPVIYGHVFNKGGQIISNSVIQLADNSFFSEASNKITDEDGYYHFNGLEKGNSYFLRGYKNDDVLNGVNTLDLINIQKHLLGIAPFVSLHQYIAADINRSGSVNVIDLLDLRKTILGIYTAFPNNQSWRFGPMPQNMDGTEPAYFKEIENIENIKIDSQKLDFIGIKVGDLTGDVNLPGSNVQIQFRHGNDLALFIDNQNLIENKPITIEFKAGFQTNITGIQLALRVDDLDLLSLAGGLIPLNSENYSFVDGILRISWNQANPIHLLNNDVLFSVNFIPAQSGLLSGRIEFAKEILLPEVYSENEYMVYPLSLGIKNFLDDTSEILFVQVDPNPFQSAVNIRFYLVNGGKTVIRFYDISGRILHVTENEYLPGQNNVQIKNNDLGLNEGIIFCQIICNGYTSTERLIKLK